MKRLAFVLVVLVLAGCGGHKTSGSAVAIGKPKLATNDPAERAGARPGAPVAGAPSLQVLKTLPSVGVRSRGASCSGTALQPVVSNLPAVKVATLCLLNRERATRGLKPLRPNGLLARAAVAHTNDMVSRAYFSHDSPSGSTFLSRIRTTGYFSAARRWTVGENLAWGAGSLASPSEIVQAWMASPGHRANILNGSFREIGIGVTLGVPAAGNLPSGATYDTGFGARI